jgi:hypothetical protein
MPDQEMNAVGPAKATRRDWIGLGVIALPCVLYSMDLTVLNLAVLAIVRAFTREVRSHGLGDYVATVKKSASLKDIEDSSRSKSSPHRSSSLTVRHSRERTPRSSMRLTAR